MRRLDGSLVAAPLAATLRGGKPRVYFATEAGSVYALDAATGAVVWERRLGAVDTIGCGSFGVSSTGAIDRSRGVLYVANADGYVYGLSLASGADVAGWPVRVTARPRTEYVWGGLRIVAGHLVVPLASYCDASDADSLSSDRRRPISPELSM